MGETESNTGTCDLCGKEADGTVEDCVNIMCMKGCHREGGDVYHQDCIKKYIMTGSRANSARQPKIPYSNFACPKGKSNKTSAAEACKGMVLHCRRIVYKNENKVVPPPPLQVINPPAERKKKKDKPKPAGGAGPSGAAATADTGGWETVGGPKKLPKLPTKPPAYRNPAAHAAVRLPPIPQAPKPDPLGRNLSSEKSQELPVGFVPEDDASGAKGKAAKKNQKRAAKRKGDSANTSMAASRGEASGSNLSGWGEGFGSEVASDAGGSDHHSLMGNTRFITDVDVFNRLLAGEVSESEAGSDDEEDTLAITTEEEHEDAQSSWDPDFTLREGVEWPVVVGQENEDDGDPDGWQSVLPGGKVSASSGSTATHNQVNNTPLVHVAPEEDAELKAVLEASAAAATTVANNAAVGAPNDDFERQLAMALAESQRAEEERLQREKAAQAALLAQYEQQQQWQQQQQQYNNSTWQNGAHVSATPILSYNQAPKSIASTVTLPAATPIAPSLATTLGLAAPVTGQPLTFSQPATTNPTNHQPYQLHSQQAPLFAPIQLPPPTSHGVATSDHIYQQQPLVPASPLPLYQQPPLQQQVGVATWQQQRALPLLNGGISTTVGLSAPQKLAAAVALPTTEDDDDTDELLALLAVS